MILGFALQTPSGTLSRLTNWSLSVTANVGLQWSVTADGLHDIDFAEAGECRFLMRAGRVLGTVLGSLDVGPLVATRRHTEEGPAGKSTVMSGTDLTSWRLGADGRDFGVYQGQPANTILADILSRTGSGIGLSGAPTYAIRQYNATQGRPVEHLARILRDGGQSFRVSPTTGQVQCVSINFVGSDYPISTWHTRRRTNDPAKLLTGYTLVKNARIGNSWEWPFTDAGFKQVTFPNALNAVIAEDLSTVGYIDLISLFNAQGGLITTLALRPGVIVPPGGAAWPATAASFIVEPAPGSTSTTVDARIRISGTPVGDEQDPYFRVTHGDTTSANARAPREPVEGILMPSAAHADSVKALLFYDLIKGAQGLALESNDLVPYDTPSFTGILDVFSKVTVPGYPLARVEAIHLAGSVGQPYSLTLECWIYPW